MARYTGYFELRPRYLEDPTSKIEVGKHYLLVNGEYVYIATKKSLPFRKTVFYDHNKKPYNSVGCSLVPNEAFNGSIYKQVTEEEFVTATSPSDYALSISPLDNATILTLEYGKSYRNRKGEIKTLLGADVCHPDSDFHQDTEMRVYDIHGRINSPYKDKSEYDLIEEVEITKPENIEEPVQNDSSLLPGVGETGIRLKKGGVYRRRDGSISAIYFGWRNNAFNTHLYIDKDDTSYDERGHFNWVTREPSIYDIVEEMGEEEDHDDDTSSTSTPPKTSFLTTVDILNIGQYVSQIEQLANKVGLDVEIRLTPSPKEGM